MSREIVRVSRKFLRERTLLGVSLNELQLKSSQRSFSEFARSLLLSEISKSNVRETNRRKELASFNQLIPDIVHILTLTNKRHFEFESANKWFGKVLQNFMTSTDKEAGLLVLNSYNLLADPDAQTDENVIKKAQIMGWCVEMLKTSLDLTNRKWDTLSYAFIHKDHPSPDFLKDSDKYYDAGRLLESALYNLLKQAFQNEYYYIDVIQQFHDVSHRAMMGKVLQNQTECDKNYDNFTMDRYAQIVKYGTAYHFFKLPVSLALYMAGVRDLELHRQARTLLLEMGQFHQMQTDFKRCFKKNGSEDIVLGRITWLAVVALQRANSDQKQRFQKAYGIEDNDAIEEIKNLYKELNIPSTYQQYEDQCYDMLHTQIQQSSRGLPHRLFYRILETWIPSKS
uniref:Farnesyl pyrophosphate synthase n=2 Tax=Cacopsylla melanoneura TaxID=428564 RepID=A0A8D8LCM0_9HEMI